VFTAEIVLELLDALDEADRKLKALVDALRPSEF
jgi:hypothetical protein